VIKRLTSLLVSRPQLVVVVFVVVTLAGFIAGARHYAEQARVQAAFDTAKSFEQSISALHEYYSEVIVPRIRGTGAEFDIHFEKDLSKFPFPATVSSRFGDALHKINPDLSSSLYSRLPFPHLKDRVLDKFEKDSLDFLEANPKSEFFRIETKNGSEFVRYARSMIMNKDCVACHNRPEFGYEGFWKVGQFRGARQVSLPVPQIAPIIDQATTMAMILAVIASLIGGLLVWPVVTRLHRTLHRTEQLAEELEVSNAELKEANRVKSTFFSIIAHDLRSPFNSLLGMTQIMVDDKARLDKDTLVSYAQDVNSAGQRFYGLLQNLLGWSQLQMAGATFDPNQVVLENLVKDSFGVLEPIAREKNIEVTSKIGDVTAYADPNMVMMIIRNLVGNALKFTESGGSINLSCQNNGAFLQITVADSGVGMSADEVAIIFEVDHRTTRDGTAGEQGTGLGLPLCKEMVEKHGGKIWAESKPGAGSKIHFTLPLKKRP